jgi:integrase
MPIKIKYAYLQHHTWMYRRHFPKDVQVITGQRAFKQTLKTSDAKEAQPRAAEVNTTFDRIVRNARAGVVGLTVEPATVPEPLPLTATPEEVWERASKATACALRATLAGETVKLDPVVFLQSGTKLKAKTVGELAKVYCRKRAGELRHGGYKSIRYSLRLVASKYGELPVTRLTREDGRWFLTAIADLSPHVGKSCKTRGFGLEALLSLSEADHRRITVKTQSRIWMQVNHFLDWAVYEGHLDANPFKRVRFDSKEKAASFGVFTDDEVALLLRFKDWRMYPVLLFALLTGMRSGEVVGLLREDLINKGNLGTFVHVRPNTERLLKTDAAERVVPLHPVLEDLLRGLPKEGPLFPQLDVSKITKDFRALRAKLKLDRDWLVFHSTRKWFITQCERAGVPEHFTASLVGHKSARSANQMTYGIYSAGISDEQKRSIIDQIRLPL